MIGSFRLPISLTSSGDTTAPTITTAKVENANPDKLVVVFSEVVTITNTTGLTITGAATPTLSAPTGGGSNTITFTLSTALTNGQAVTLNVASSNTIKDAANNALAATTETITNNVAAVTVIATGGTITQITDGGVNYKVHTFTSSGAFAVTGPLDIQYLVVAGGGGGNNGINNGSSGGGGAGGLIYKDVAVTISSDQTITIGSGGISGANGGDSSLETLAITIGGGRGGGEFVSYNGAIGGSGGGGGMKFGETGNGGAGTSPQGNAGSVAAALDGIRQGGGGGGFSAAAIDRFGGAGFVSSFDGTSKTYSKGGDSITDTNGIDAPANTGNGGEGAGSEGIGSKGGSGIVIIRYVT